jgi:opacity protein-like surface antigen
MLQMKNLFAVLVLLAVSGIPTFAQDKPLFEVSGGYTFQSWQVPTYLLPPPDYYHYNGFNAGGAFHFTQLVSLALDVTGTYNTFQGESTSIYSYLAGPRIYPLGHRRLTPYVHGLFGAASYNVPSSEAAAVPSETKFAWEVGAGLEYSLLRHIAIRLGQFDYEQTRFLHSEDVQSGLSKSNQDNYKYSAGIVFRFGEK